ncbi:high choriolytic enzyme 1-like [Periophthalmus magnuspinnatus]|uniref:high choriolytic enzyme 1-like n=1 Tax=Periophthalmus magnuspinnatus TaxID=409849 RepID=UPI00145B0C82|nr:high choriolytic enzyme 1-like [Periophthalmus magnuspinnatus]
MARVIVLTVFLTLLSLGSTASMRNKLPEQEGRLDILETLLNVNPQDDGTLIEGDIKMKELESNNGSPDDALSNAAACTSSTCLWEKHEDGHVYVRYVISSDFSKFEKNFIQDAMKVFEEVTCIRFEELNKREQQLFTNYINIISATGCWSYVGRQAGVQDLSLQKNGCMHKQIIQHELLHALGFYHEHNRSDRDDYVNIFYENILAGAENNFKLFTTNNLETSYDFFSVLQYSNRAFSANGQMTIQAKHDPSFEFGFATTMSENDKLRTNRLYNCTTYLP